MNATTSREGRVSSPPPGSRLGVSDYQLLLGFSSNECACFAFDKGISFDLPPHAFADAVWGVPSRCVDANATFLAAHELRRIGEAGDRGFASFFPRTDQLESAVLRWCGGGFAPYRFETQTEGIRPRILRMQLYSRIGGGKLRYLWMIGEDVTEERKRLDALRQAEHHFRTLVEGPGLGLVLVRVTVDGRYLYVSPGGLKNVGYTIEDFNRDPELFSKLIHPDDVPKHSSIYQARYERWREPVEVEYRVRGKDGTYRCYFERQTPKFDANGEIEYFDSVCIDIQQRRLLEAQIEHAQRLDMLGGLAAGIAHDLNNHLTAVLGQIALGLRALDSRHSAYRNFEQAEKAGGVCAEITRNLLSIGRKGAEETKRSVDLGQLVTETAHLLSHVLPSTIDLVVERHEDVRFSKGNKTQLQQVLMNLILNAAEASGNSGEITVEVRNRPLTYAAVESATAARRYPDLPLGCYVEVSVTDRGCGIPESHVPYLFDPFFTTKPTGKGSGLGLTMVHSIIRSHGGSIQVASEPGVRTEFSFVIPASDEAPEERLERKLLAPRGREAILVADDDDMVRTMVVTLLTHQGYTVFQAANGMEAVEVFKEHRDEISAVLVDLTMPKLSGKAAIERMRELVPTLSVILTSGYGGAEVENLPEDDRRLAFLMKPYPLNELLTLLRSVIEAPSRRLA